MADFNYLTDEAGNRLTDDTATLDLTDVTPPPPPPPPSPPPSYLLIPGNIGWMNQSTRTVHAVQTLDQNGILVNQYSDETGFINYTTEDLTSDYIIENPVFDLVRWS